ncbi:hypothetical protein HUT19_37665 [Streptomyces sp. NA02950]|uniref:hypothetical protein n=1 Tax=Streptomyces sp. NA02950 TaxID=2742137 RepID=UPI0015907AC3|nr:hypothetical protein [Streptomyces sp. NA02950]QKV96723.1 hypothetical protein HUT19_37665 [Streptomyces sp. NA02950]
MTTAATRYHIQRTAPNGPFVIYDNALDGFCTLKDQHDNLLPLEWDDERGALSWLNRCARLWSLGAVPAPRNWSTWRAPRQSPWQGLPYVDCAVCGCGTFEFRPKLVNNVWRNACPRCQ